MALRGETIGTAYVRVIADGSGFPRSVKEQLDNGDEVYRDGAERHANIYEKSFDQRMKRNDVIAKNIHKQIERAGAQMHADAHLIADDDFWKRVGFQVGDMIKEGIGDGLSPRDIQRLTDHVVNNMQQSFARTGTIDRDLRGAIGRGIDDLYRMDRATKRVDNDSHKWFRTLDRVSEGMGKAFGAGARNNFVNLVGIVIGGFVKMGVAAIKGVVLLGDWVKGMGEATQASAKFAEGNAAVAAAVEEASAEVAAAGPPAWIAVAVAIGAIAFIAPVAVSAISALAAAVVAVASSMAFAVAGGVGVFAGLMLPLAGAIGVVVLGFKDLKKELKGADFKPLKKEFKELREVAGHGIAEGIKDALPDITKLLDRIIPIVKGISAALGDVIQRFAAIADSRAFRFFTRTMGILLPDAIHRIGIATANFAEGMLNVFGVLGEPGGPVDKFINWLVEISDEFDKWSSKKKGRQDIRQFFEDASVSGQKWWDLLKSIGGTLRRLFFSKAGKESGDNIVVQISDAFDRLNKWLDEHPDAIRQWFKDGERIATQVGHAVQSIVEIFDTLDTPENRKAAAVTIGAIALHLRIVNKILEVAGAAFHGFNHIVKTMLASTALAFATWAGDLIGLALKAFGWVPGVKEKLNKAAVYVEAFKSRANAALHGIDNRVEIKITADARQAIAETAAYQAQLNNIPPSVTTSFIVKMTKQLGQAEGGIFAGPQHVLIGEAGPEAIVPLHRSLSQVDPSVRWLSAIAQGKADMTTNNNNSGVNVGGITIVTPTRDPAAVARETINRLVAASYLN